MNRDLSLLHEEQVELGTRSYPVTIGCECLDDVPWWAAHCPFKVVAVITNTVVAPLYLARVVQALGSIGRRVITIVIEDGEAHKTQTTLDFVYDELLNARCPRDACIVALGGGVVGDMAGFAAATYQRGIAFIQVPTTLLAQVDSSVGGKTAINHARGKNMIGAFHQPNAVLIDVAVLNTLPAPEFAAGMAEVIKHAAIADATYLDFISRHQPEIAGRDPATLVTLVRRSVRIKADIVAVDEQEHGLRATLNFGHTFAHAIETGMGYGHWLHGEAVAAGMAMACALSTRLGLLESADQERLLRALTSCGLPIKPPFLPSSRWHALMALDKKVAHGELRFVLLTRLGEATVRAVPQAALDDVLESFSESHAREAT